MFIEIFSAGAFSILKTKSPDEGLGRTFTSKLFLKNISPSLQLKPMANVLLLPAPQGLFAFTLRLPEVLPKFTVTEVEVVVSVAPEEVTVPSEICDPVMPVQV